METKKKSVSIIHVGIVICAILFFGTIPFIVKHVNKSSDTIAKSVVEASAQEEARRMANALKVVRNKYTTDVVSIAKGCLKITHDYADPKWDSSTVKAIPLPATLSMSIAKALSEKGTNVALYSTLPFPWRAKGGYAERTLSDFQKNAYEYFVKTHDGKTESELEFQEFDRESNVLNYAIPDLMVSPVCVNCHNTVANSPKTDWKLGDVRGAISIQLPLKKEANIDTQIATASQGTMSYLIIMAGIGLLIFILIFVTNRANAKMVRLANEEMVAMQENANKLALQNLEEQEAEFAKKIKELEDKLRK